MQNRRKKIKESLKLTTLGFTLVELLAVIVILAIILVIAVPKVMSVIEDSKKATLESTAKMIASAAEKAKVQNTVLGKEKKMNCKDIVKLNDVDYERCIIEFDSNNNALVTIKGKGKFSSLNICAGDKTNATASNEVCNVSYGRASTYIEKLEAFNGGENYLQKTTATYNGTTYDAGIRYVGALDEVKNKIYYNCDEKDSSNIYYGESNYDYANSCEEWRIIGVFDVEDENGNKTKRLKIININSTFKASWDSSSETKNLGFGVNQWGESIYIDTNGVTQIYPGSDLMQLLNGYYVDESKSECKYNNANGQSELNQTCTKEQLITAKMKPLTNNAKEMIENSIWWTYAVHNSFDPIKNINVENAYLQEKGISGQYTGSSECIANVGCNHVDEVERTTEWFGLVGLMSSSDIAYASGWLYNSSIYPWSISPVSESSKANRIWVSGPEYAGISTSSNFQGVWPSVYLKHDLEIIDGNGDNAPYILK